MVNEPTVNMTRAKVIRGPKIDPRLILKLELTAAITVRCDLGKLFNGEDSSAWKTHNMKDCKSKDYFKGKVAGNNKLQPNNHTKDKGNYTKSYALKKQARKEVKRAMKRKDAGYSSASDSSSDSE